MNEYGRLALHHWRRHLPTRYAALEDPQAFFTQLGEQASQAVLDREEALQTQLGPGEGYLDRVGTLTAIRDQAREQVLAEMILLPPEPEPGERVPAGLATVRPDGMPSDPDHPLWADLEDETVTPAEFQRRVRAWRESLPPTR